MVGHVGIRVIAMSSNFCNGTKAGIITPLLLFFFLSSHELYSDQLLPSVCAMELELAAIFWPALTGSRCRLYNRPSRATLFF